VISIRALGPLVIKVDGQEPPPELQWKKVQSLLLYLVFAPRHTRSKDHVMGMLWPDARRPSASLNQARWLLKEYGGVVIAEDRDQLRLDPKNVEVDTTRFEQLVREKKWPEAAAMVEGTFLDGFTASNTSGFDEWLEGEREKRRAKCGDVLIRAAKKLVDGGAVERAEPIAERAQQLLPYSDEAICIHLTVLGLEGRRSEAKVVGVLFEKRLAEVGRHPEPSTTKLLAVIDELAPAPDPELSQKPRPPLVGRSAKLEEVVGVWEAARAGTPGVVLVLGDEGMGKTRFIEEVMDRARLNGATVAITRGVPGDTNHQWIGLKTLIDGGLLGAPGIAGAPPAAVAALGEQSLLWAARFPVKAPGEPLGLLQAGTEVIRATALEHPVLLVADDAQWIDGESLQALIGLVRSLAENRVMLLLTASSDPPRAEIDQIRSRIGSDLNGVTVRLEPLGRDDLIVLARWALPKYTDDQLDRIARRVGAESAGFPLIAYVIFTAVADGLELGDIGEPWPRRKNTYEGELPVDLADNLVGALNVRFGRLATDAQSVLRVLAVLGGPCTAKHLERGSDLPRPRVERALDELETRQWVVADARGYAFLAWTFRSIVRKRHVRDGEAIRIQERMIAT